MGKFEIPAGVLAKVHVLLPGHMLPKGARFFRSYGESSSWQRENMMLAK